MKKDESEENIKQAVIRINGRQYEVAEGKEFLADRVSSTEINPEVLLVYDNKEVKLGKPLVKGVKVEVEMVGEEKGKKLEILKYKAKARYRRHYGFRPIFSRLKVKSIRES